MVVVPRNEKKEGRNRGRLPPTAARLTRLSCSSSSQGYERQPSAIRLVRLINWSAFLCRGSHNSRSMLINSQTLLLRSLAVGTSIVHLRTCSVVLQEPPAHIMVCVCVCGMWNESLTQNTDLHFYRRISLLVNETKPRRDFRKMQRVLTIMKEILVLCSRHKEKLILILILTLD